MERLKRSLCQASLHQSATRSYERGRNRRQASLMTMRVAPTPTASRARATTATTSIASRNRRITDANETDSVFTLSSGLGQQFPGRSTTRSTFSAFDLAVGSVAQTTQLEATTTPKRPPPVSL